MTPAIDLLRVSVPAPGHGPCPLRLLEPLQAQAGAAGPTGARIALWIVPTLEFFPLDMAPKGVKPPGGLERPYPDYWNYTLRDYGNRVGFARIFRALENARPQGLGRDVRHGSPSAIRMCCRR